MGAGRRGLLATLMVMVAGVAVTGCSPDDVETEVDVDGRAAHGALRASARSRSASSSRASTVEAAWEPVSTTTCATSR